MTVTAGPGRPVIPGANVPLVDPSTGLLTPVWYQVFALLLRASPGWGAAEGTATRTSFDTTSVTTEELAERVKAIIDDDFASGRKGA